MAGGAELLDVKEPGRGSLGMASWAAIDAVVSVVGGRIPVSVACGELARGDFQRWSGQRWEGVQFAKLGLSEAPSDWQAEWLAWSRMLPLHITRIAVVYADWQAAQAPPPRDVLAFAKCHAGGVLLDTYFKCRSLTQIFTWENIAGWIEHARVAGLPSAVAGSLEISQLPRLAALQPAVLAVRGAVCTPDRTGRLHQAKVRLAADALQLAPLGQRHADPVETPADP